ncbi:MAG TPA: DUF922 domain-containing protein [Chitinophagales bacterium]|nr:DUF922 domain-containing protein [Chitinophagales bacterium]
MKMLLLSLFLILSFEKSFSLTDEIRWQESRRLTFSDFRGHVPLGTSWAASTSSAIHFGYETTNGVLSNVVVYASFNPEKSWMKKNLAVVLAHEQLHFDITEVFTRKFYHEVMKKSSASKNELNVLFQKENKDCEEMQRQYDDETDHGTIEDEQVKWVEKVSAMLQGEEQYPSK